VLSATYKVGNDRTDTLVSLINANKDKIGAFDGNVNDFLNKFKSDPQYQKLKTILTMTQADTRKFFA
jgi:deoxyxylulose-5-phosphate synthase